MSNIEDEFFALVERPLNTKPVLVNGKEYVLHELSEGDAAEMEVAMQDKKGKFDLSRHRRLMVAYCLHDIEGNRVISEPERLKGLPKQIVGKLYEDCLALSSYDAKEIEDLVKKSDPAQG
jgi:hypothetical protein